MKKILLLLIVLISINSQAQSYYSGRVINTENKQPLSDVCVALLAKDSVAIGMCYSDSNGKFTLQTRKGKRGAFLSFVMMGFANKILPLSSFESDETVPLQSEALKIREVKITSRRIVDKNDTLTYSMAGFSMKSDRTVVDVIKKMPGLEVSSTGAIKFQGKPISKLYIEGLNLLGNKYSLATNNLSNKSVKKVQVLKNHQAIAALRGKSFTDQAAINLVLSDEAKMQVGGTFDLAGGYSASPNNALYSARLMVFFFGHNKQNFSMYKGNNIGENIANEIRPLSMNDLLERQNGVTDESGLLSTSQIYIPNVDESKYYFNDSHLLTTNHLIKCSKETTLRFQLNALHEKLDNNLKSFTSYFYPDQQIDISEQHKSHIMTNKLDGSVKYEKNKSKLYLKNNLFFSTSYSRGDNDYLTNNSKINSRVSPTHHSIKDELKLVKNFNDKSFAFTTVNAYDYFPQTLTVSPGLYSNLFGLEDNYNSFRQSVDLHSFRSHTSTTFRHRLGAFNISYRLGTKIKSQKIYSGVSSFNDFSYELVPNVDFDNQLSLFYLKGYLEPSLNIKKANYTLKLEIPISYNLYQLRNDYPAHTSQNINRVRVEPSLLLVNKLSRKWELSNNLRYHERSNDIHQLYSGYIFDDYRSTSRYNPELAFEKLFDYYPLLKFSDSMKSFFVTFGGTYNLKWKDHLYERSVEGILTKLESKKMNTKSSSWGTSLRLAQGFNWCKSFLVTRVAFNSNNDNMLFSNKLVPINYRTLTTNLEYSLQPSPQFTIESKFSFLKMWMKAKKIAASNSTENYQAHLNLCYLPNSSLRISLKNDYYRLQKPQVANLYFADFDVTYTYKDIEFSAVVANLFNNRSMTFNYLSSLNSSQVNYLFSPRKFLFKCSFRL